MMPVLLTATALEAKETREAAAGITISARQPLLL